MLLSNPCSPLISLSIFQLQNEKRRLEKDLEEIKRQKEEQEEENERMKQEVASLRYVCHAMSIVIIARFICCDYFESLWSQKKIF